jgi:hypothetical protein
MPETLTTNYSLVKPEVGIVGATQWSTRLNEDLDSLDTIIKDLQDQIDVLSPDAPVDLTTRIETLERLLNGRRTLRRVETNTSVSLDLAAGGDGLWVTATGSGGKVITLVAPDADQTVDGTADGTFCMQEGYLVIQNIGSGTISYTASGASISWIDGDGGGIGPQSTPGGLLRFYKWIAFTSTGSSESPPSNRIYLFRVAL